MTAYAIGLLDNLVLCADIISYLQRIDATLEPFGGSFLVHGAHPEIKEGTFDGDCVLISFPSIENARSWYHSDAYAELIPLRTRHSESTVFFLEGVGQENYRAETLAHKLKSRVTS